MLGQTPVGKVAAVANTTNQEFEVVINDSQYLQLDDLVMVESTVPTITEPVITYGIVVATEGTYENAKRESDVFRISRDGIMPAYKIRTATVSIIRVLPEVWVSPDPGGDVYRADGEHRAISLYEDTMTRALPVGIARDGQPVCVDLDFFDGTKGGHISISGISGVATKTSYAMFFLRALTSNPAIVNGEDNTGAAANMRILVFNVKGEDLMWLDYPNRNPAPKQDIAATWQQIGIEPTPFPDVSFWSPPRRRSGDVNLPTPGRLTGVNTFGWTPREFIDEGLLSYLFTDASGEHNNQVGFVVERVRIQLKRWAVDVPGQPGAVKLRNPNVSEGISAAPPGVGDIIISNLSDMVAVIGKILEPEDGLDASTEWSGRVQIGTIWAFMRRLRAASLRIGHLIQTGDTRRVNRKEAQITVVSIQNLHDLGQRFVVGALLKETFKEKEEHGGRLPLSVILLDELNKYAPRNGSSPLKEMLVDIAQRGRSLGVILVGAQQTASKVTSELFENASIKVVGRLDSAESSKKEYGWLTPSARSRARLLQPGSMILSQPSVPVPTLLSFPFPSWATRKEEAEDSSDPFEGI